MSDFLVRNLDKSTLARLKSRAKRSGRSLQSEARLILEQAARSENAAAALRSLRAFRRSLGRSFDDSTALIREDRAR